MQVSHGQIRAQRGCPRQSSRTNLGLSGEHGPALKAVYHYGYRLELSPAAAGSQDVA